MQASKIVEEEMETKIVNILKEYGKPVSVGYVAYNAKVCWSTARGFLFKMSLNGRLKAIETSKGFFFALKNNA
jgi:hypothetical protein